MNRNADKKIVEYIEELSSKAPTPGGGATAALTGALAASLAEMVCNLTIGKEKYLEVETEVLKTRTEVSKIKDRLLDLSDLDSVAFTLVMDAYRMPKEKAQRTEKIQEALRGATKVPLETAFWCSKIMVFGERLSLIGNKNAFSDAKSAIHLAKGAMLSALENVDINLQSLTDKKYIAEVKAKLAQIKKVC
jgi:methenyltetrahydrofolate cyclohydrolase